MIETAAEMLIHHGQESREHAFCYRSMGLMKAIKKAVHATLAQNNGPRLWPLHR
jgi:hypothetical protein